MSGREHNQYQTVDLDTYASYRDVEKVKREVAETPVTFITPPSTFLADERVFPFLGPLKIAAEMRQNGNPVDFLDLSGYGNYTDIIRDYARQTEVRDFALTATTPQIPAAIRVVETLREEIPDAQITLGGAHATLTHAGMVMDNAQGRRGRGTMAFEQLPPYFDKIVIGDGELAMFYALDPNFKPQVIDAGNLKSPLFLPKASLVNFEFPARDLINIDSYHFTIDGKRAFSAIGQLGCPFKCNFCGGRDSHAYRVARPRAVTHVIREIEEVIIAGAARGVDYSAVMFYDDELNVIPDNLESLCRELLDLQDRLGKEMSFRGFVKAELFNEEQARLMRRAGFSVLLTGIESGSDLILKAIEKNTTREINTTLVKIAHDAGLDVKALMSAGQAGETEETINESIDWALSCRPDDIDWTVITPYPGAPYQDKSEYDPDKKAWVFTTVVDGQPMRLYSDYVDYRTQVDYYKGVPGKYKSYVSTDELSSDDLVRLRDMAEYETRTALHLPPITAVEPLQFEHSMGQKLPDNILRRST